jgi:hypothetical protein
MDITMKINHLIIGSLFAFLATMSTITSSSPWYSKDRLQETGRRWKNNAYDAKESVVNAARNNPRTAIAVGVVGVVGAGVLYSQWARLRGTGGKIYGYWKERPMWARTPNQKRARIEELHQREREKQRIEQEKQKLFEQQVERQEIKKNQEIYNYLHAKVKASKHMNDYQQQTYNELQNDPNIIKDSSD